MVGINPGELREPVEFYNMNRSESASGKQIVTPALAFQTNAKIVNDKPSRAIESGQLRSISTRTVIIRYAASRIITIDMQMKWQGDMYQILDFDDLDGTKLWIKLTVTRS